jgi:hypothetical protein
MLVTKLKTVAALATVAAGLLVQQALGDKLPVVSQTPEEKKTPTTDKARRATRLDLTAESFPRLHTLIRPHDHEWRHLKVQWLTDVTAVRKKAAAEDKPIIICYTGGAGYNEPLGVC